jgi:hypothetical protein
VATPEAIPVTMPPEETEATVVGDEDHEPPDPEVVKVTGVPKHTVVGPEIRPAFGVNTIVMFRTRIADPHELELVYVNVAVPGAIPVTTPVDAPIDAIDDGEQDQDPPEVESV